MLRRNSQSSFTPPRFSLWGTFYVSPMKGPRRCRMCPSTVWTSASSGFQVSLRTGMPREVRWCEVRWCEVRWCPRGCCAWLVPLHSLTHRYGVVLLCLSRGRLRIFCDAPRHLQSRCWFAICLFSAIVLVHGLVTCRGRSRGRCRNSCWYVLSPSLQHFVHFAHLLCFICPISHGVP